MTSSTPPKHMGYKKVANGYIAELEIIGKTNESRSNAVCPETAKFRTAAAKVLRIYHPRTGHTVKSAAGLYDPTFIYRVGQVARPKDTYDPRPELVCSHGIHYYKTLAPALHWNYNVSRDGPRRYVMEWHENGRLVKRTTYDTRHHIVIESLLWTDDGRPVTPVYHDEAAKRQCQQRRQQRRERRLAKKQQATTAQESPDDQESTVTPTASWWTYLFG